MLSLASLWLPILLAAVAVFFTSSLVHMVFKWHNADYRPLANEDEVREVIRRSNPTPGQYVVPYCVDGKDMQKPGVQQKFIDGPVGFLLLCKQSDDLKMEQLATIDSLTGLVIRRAFFEQTEGARQPEPTLGHRWILEVAPAGD